MFPFTLVIKIGMTNLRSKIKFYGIAIQRIIRKGAAPLYSPFDVVEKPFGRLISKPDSESCVNFSQ